MTQSLYFAAIISAPLCDKFIPLPQRIQLLVRVSPEPQFRFIRMSTHNMFRVQQRTLLNLDSRLSVHDTLLIYFLCMFADFFLLTHSYKFCAR